MCKNTCSAMARYTKQFLLTSKVLQQLVTTENSCVEIENHKRHMTLFPYHLKNVSASIRDILDEDIGKFDKDYDGILLGYKHLKLLTSEGSINYDCCYIHIDIQADFVLFKPAAGKELPAIVTKKSRDHVGCLVYHTFNVSLPKPEGIEHWTGNDVEIGEEVIIKVTYAKLDAKLPYIKGEFLNNISEYTSCIYEKPVNKKLKFDEEDEEIVPKQNFGMKEEIDNSISKKKRKKIDTGVSPLSEDTNVKKKRKVLSQEELNFSVDADLLSITPKKKKKHAQLMENETTGLESENSKSKKKRKLHSVESETSLFEFQKISPKKEKKHSKSKECSNEGM
ncbi:hypothetical protein WA026_022226 [Henosepilachna vigintioctopunctata]|uniref:DNA-directed RNA polymerase I subunit RPA43 n=1 Tax=Henosepilachna vigintioctopunctata TaxID=420089 RepID=A0AAW1UN45_9CUCU